MTQLLNISEKNLNFKAKPPFKNWWNNCRRYGRSIAEYGRNQQANLK